MPDITFNINLFIFLIELEHTLNTSNKRTDIALPIYFFNWSRTSIIKTSNKRTHIALSFISLIEVEHPLKTSNKRTHV